jgi:SAM-dependent methyltransferase
MPFDFKLIELEDTECIICHSKENLQKLFSAPDRLNNLPGIFHLVRCEKCGLVFQNPRPKEECIHYYYPESMDYFNPKEPTRSKLAIYIEKIVLINFYKYRNLGGGNIFQKILSYPFFIYIYKHQSIPQYKNGGKLLEIGCANGIRLKKMKDIGWKVKGIEPSKKASESARSERNIDVETGSIFDFSFPENSFDVIILDMVLEHLYSPDIAIKKISRWLKPNGQLIFSIPYFEGFEYVFFKKYSYGLHLPNHITFFNKNSLFHLLNNDFKKIQIVFQHFDRDIVASSSYKYKATNKQIYALISKNKLVRLAVIKPFVFLLSLLQKSSRITVFARKK